MVVLKIGCINVKYLGLPWKHGHLLNNLSVDVTVISETNLSVPLAFISHFTGYEIYLSLGLLGGWYCCPFPEMFGFENKAIFLDPEGWLVVLDVISSDGTAFRLVAAYAPTGAG